MDEMTVDYQFVGIVISVIAALLISFYFGGLNQKKEFQEYKTGMENTFATCRNYCSALNETDFLRFEPKDGHYKCMCYSYKTKLMEDGI